MSRSTIANVAWRALFAWTAAVLGALGAMAATPIEFFGIVLAAGVAALACALVTGTEASRGRYAVIVLGAVLATSLAVGWYQWEYSEIDAPRVWNFWAGFGLAALLTTLAVIPVGVMVWREARGTTGWRR